MKEQIFYFKGKDDFINNLPWRSVFFGEGVFETFRFKNELPVFFDRHMYRLKSGCDFLSIPAPEINDIEDFIRMSVKESGFEDAYVKLCILSSGDRVYYGVSENYSMLALIGDHVIPPRSLRVNICSYLRNSRSAAARYKTTSYIENVISKRRSINYGYDESLYLNENGYVTECTSSNIFWMSGDNIYTPSIENGLLAGVMRGILIDLCREMDISVIEGSFYKDDILQADCAFVTNSSVGVIPVLQLDTHRLSFERAKFDEIRYKLLTVLKWK